MFEFSSMDQGTLILTVSTCVLGTLLVIVLIWLCLKSYNVRCFPGRKEPQQDLRTPSAARRRRCGGNLLGLP